MASLVQRAGFTRATTSALSVVVSVFDAMACFNPLGGWMGQRANDSGRYPVVFRLRDGWIDKPIDLPCGKCIGCLQDKARSWAIRCYHESTQHRRNAFVTLTYRDENCPDQVSKPDLQLFFKRLRARGVKFRYFACGEYGGMFGRPHYHCLFFGQDFREGSQALGIAGEYYTSKFLDDTWSNGHVTVAPCEPGSVFYTAGYQLKNLDQPTAFHLGSRRPYIGAGWLSRYHDDIARLGFVTIEGKKFPIPASYLKRPEFAAEFEELVESRRAHIEGLSPGERWDRRSALRSREKNLARKTTFKKAC